MEGKIVGLFLIALIGGLVGGFGLSYIIYQPQVQNLQTTTKSLQTTTNNLQDTINSLQNQVTNLNFTLKGLQNMLNTTGVGIGNQVQVSGTVYSKQTGTIYFRTANESVRTSSPITNGNYSVLLVGGQSYDIYIDYYASSNYYTPDFVLYVPLGVTVFTANF